MDFFHVAVYRLTELEGESCEKGVAKRDQAIGQCQLAKESCFRQLGAAESRRECNHSLVSLAGFLIGIIAILFCLAAWLRLGGADYPPMDRKLPVVDAVPVKAV